MGTGGFAATGIPCTSLHIPATGQVNGAFSWMIERDESLTRSLRKKRWLRVRSFWLF